MNLLLPTLALTAHLCAVPAPLGGIALFNPTEWRGSALVEVPTGRIAAPGLIDWAKVRLVVEGKEIPFFLREGRAHWRARLTPPATPPRAEDLLVFWCSVPPGKWVRVDVMPGGAAAAPAVTQTGTAIDIDYANLHATIDPKTGMLTRLRAYGTDLLAAPMKAAFNRVAEDSFRIDGPIGAGYMPFSATVERGAPLPVKARCVSAASTPAMTEISFVLEPDGGPAMALTYRIHAAGLVEMVADERPWRGTSPWLRSAARFTLPLAGDATSLPYLEERMPFYGFKDYNAAFDQTAEHRTLGETQWLVLGEETVNGRRWLRRLFTWREGPPADAVEMMNEGLVVKPVPVSSGPMESVRLRYPPEAGTVAGLLTEVLNTGGVTVAEEASKRITLAITNTVDAIDTDGFDIRASGDDITLRSTNLLGLYQAVRAIATQAQQQGLSTGLPLVARNPVVPLRGGGFGGGGFEVDFPYGSDENWEKVFDGLLDSGMNVFWCLGMWSNWKFPVTYKYMPELQSNAPDAYDESSGVLFSEMDAQREHALRLLKYLHERGAPVYLWLPIGCVPTTFLERHPEALKPGSVAEFWGRPKGTPCFTHPAYKRYIDAFLRELVETYDLDGVVLVRDDNGGVCDCERCQAYVAKSRTKSAVWEQYLQIHDALRKLGFKGVIGVYPYQDGYTPALDPLLPKDLIVAGHGASLAALARRYERVGHMPETWLDNLYTNFRLPSTSRVRRLLADRGIFWIGGAYCGTELPWEGIGYFGWEPTATANSLRYHWGERTFGPEAALKFAALSDAYEALWDMNARFMVPNAWMAMTPDERHRVTREGMAELETFGQRFAALKNAVDTEAHATWLEHLGLWPTFFEYHLRRMGRFAEIHDLVAAHGKTIDTGGTLPANVRATVLSKYAEIYDWAERYGTALRKVPGDMPTQTRNLTLPYKEWMAGYDGWLDPWLERPQFRGTMDVEDVKAVTGQPFTVRVALHNTGICPWVERAGQAVTFSGKGEALGLPARFVLTGEAVAPGDRRVLAFSGTAPAGSGHAEITVAFYNPFRVPTKIIEKTFTVTWSEG